MLLLVNSIVNGAKSSQLSNCRLQIPLGYIYVVEIYLKDVILLFPICEAPWVYYENNMSALKIDNFEYRFLIELKVLFR